MWMAPGGLLLVSFAIKSYWANGPLYLLVLAMIAYLILQARYERWKCPRCGQQFQRAGQIAAECANCGLPKWSGLQ